MYAVTVTRTDIAYTANILSRFLLNPSQQHINAADHYLAYLDTYRTLAIEFSDISNNFRVFHYSSDAAFADNPNYKSSQGYLFKLYSGAIT